MKLSEKRAVQRGIQVRIEVEVQLKTQRTMRLPTLVATQLKVLVPVWCAIQN